MEEAVQFKKVHEAIEIKSGTYRPQCYKNHLHHELSIGVVRSGESVVSFGDGDLSFTKGEGIVIPPYVSHMCSPKDIEKWSFLMIYIDKSFYDGDLEFKTLRKMTPEEGTVLESIINTYEELLDKNVLEEALINLLILISKNSSVVSHELNQGSETIQPIYEYIKEHYLEKISLDDLVKLYKINKFTLIRKFKTIYNTTPSAFQLQLKLAQVKEEIGQGKDIHDICLELGFYDQAHIIREFKHIHGITPNQYAKNMEES